jgi:hypothetical protein
MAILFITDKFYTANQQPWKSLFLRCQTGLQKSVVLRNRRQSAIDWKQNAGRTAFTRVMNDCFKKLKKAIGGFKEKSG